LVYVYKQDGSPINNNFRISYSEIANRPYVSVKGILRPALSINNNGDFAVVWSDMKGAFSFGYDYANIDIYGQIFSKDLTPIGENIQLVGAGSSNRYNPAIVLKDSVLIMSWSDQTSQLVYMQRFLFDGTPLEEQSKVFDNDTSDFSFLSKSSIAMNEDGNFIIVWDGRQNDIYGQRFTQEGITVGSNFRLTNTSNGYQNEPDAFLFKNRIYSTWVDNRSEESGFDIWANVLDWYSPVGVEDIEINKPNSYHLYQNYPNPFNPSTTIKYSISSIVGTGHPTNTGQAAPSVQLKVYDILGREVASLVNKQQKPGSYEVNFYADKLPSGIYFYKLQAGKKSQVKKMMLLK